MKRWPLFERLLVAQSAFLTMLWAGLLFLTLGVAVAIAVFGTLQTSVWEQASQLSWCFALFIGVYLTGTYLRLAVAHGQTRRNFMVQAAAFVVVYTALFAALMTLGYLAEMALYRLGDWSQTLLKEHLFDSPGQVGPIFVTYWLVLAVYLVVGAMIAAAFQRNGLLGAVSILVGLALVAPTDLVIGFTPTPVVVRVFLLLDTEAGSVASVAVCAASLAVALAATWAIVRDQPIRPLTA